jgi:hypothetical protein
VAAEGVGAEARAVAEGEGEVAAAVGVERRPAGGRHEAEHQGFGLGGGPATCDQEVAEITRQAAAGQAGPFA